MSACYLYAIIHAPEKALGMLGQAGPGLGERSLALVAYHELAAVISDRSPTAGSPLHAPLEADLWRHEQVIEGIMAHTPTLPVRFGTTLADTDHVQQMLVQREADFATDLAYVAGRVEIGLRVLWQPPAMDPVASDWAGGSSGRRYLQQQMLKHQQEKKIHDQGEALVGALDKTLQPFVVDKRLQILRTEHLLLSGAYLVQQTLVTAFQAQVEALRQAYPDLSFLSSGPWPTYHFVSHTEPTGNL